MQLQKQSNCLSNLAWDHYSTKLIDNTSCLLWGRLLFVATDFAISDECEQRDDVWCASGADFGPDTGPLLLLSPHYGHRPQFLPPISSKTRRLGGCVLGNDTAYIRPSPQAVDAPQVAPTARSGRASDVLSSMATCFLYSAPSLLRIARAQCTLVPGNCLD